MPTLTANQIAIARFHIQAVYSKVPENFNYWVNIERSVAEITLLNNLITRIETAYTATASNGGSLNLESSTYLDRNESTTTQQAIKDKTGNNIIGYTTYTTVRQPRTTNIYKRDSYNTRNSAYCKEVERLYVTLGL